MDIAIRKITIAEQAARAARLAADTLTHQPNEYEPGTEDHAAFEAAYARYFSQFTAPEGEASA